jgi:hypothetical protein
VWETRMNKGYPQSLLNLFSLQANGAAAGAENAAVVQDKGRIASARSHLSQPAPLATGHRPHHLNRKPPRSQKHRSTKRKTIHLVLWVNPIVNTDRSAGLLPDGSVRAGGFPRLPPDPGELTAGSIGSLVKRQLTGK